MATSPGIRQWAATAAATVTSTYLLDAIAAGAGALLVASDLLAAARPGQAAAFLLFSYIAWGAALRPGLGANWALLERTGTSTSLPSKIVHDLFRDRGFGTAARRLAASAGYVGTELAKEAPYYLGAGGAALIGEGVSAADALTFLAGANLGAAAYELGLSRVVRVMLARGSRRRYATFEADWDPKAYLTDYYSTVEADEKRTISYLVDAVRGVAAGQSVLVFGVGPTLHHVFPLAPIAATIDLCDVLPANLSEIQRWVAARPGAHDWHPFVRHALACEGGDATDAAVPLREALTRSRIGRLKLADLRDPAPLAEATGRYDIVVSAYCAESATSDLRTWALYMERVAGLVRPGGLLIVAALRRSRGYRVGGRLFPSANVDEEDMRAVLAPLASSLRVETCLLPEMTRLGYSGIILARATFRSAGAAN